MDDVFKRIYRMRMVRLATFFLGLLALQGVAAQTLDEMIATALPGDQTELRFRFSDEAPSPKIYVVDSPARLVMDLWGVTKSDQLARSISVGSGSVSTVNFAQTPDRMRVVVAMTESVAYETSIQGNELLVRLGVDEVSADTLQAGPLDTSTGTRIVGIDFERIDGDAGRVTISLSDDQAGLDIIEEGTGVIVNLNGATLTPGLAQKLDVKAFATPIDFIDAMNADGSAAVLILPSSDPYDYLAYQSNNQLVLDFKPVSLGSQIERQAELFPFSGQEIDLNFQSVEVRSVLQIIAEVAEKNLVVGEEVGGNTTLRLKNVPWDQALDIILKTNGLDKRIVGNVMLVGDAGQIAERERQELENQQQVKELAPLVTEYIQIDYRRASEMKDYLSAANLISERGFVLSDDQTNVLMVRETNAAIEDIRRTLKRFDVEVAQIMVEARVVTASANFSESLGVKWGFANGPTTVMGDGQLSLGSSITGPGVAGVGQTGLNVDFGVAGPSLAVGFIKNSLLLSAELSALESSGNGEVISQPKVITTNGKAANITSGQQIPYQTVEDGTTTTAFKDVALSLNVTPQLNPGDRIAMDLAINQDSVGSTLANGEISINTNQLTTSVVVSDGDTIVLGGVFRTEASDGVQKVPGLGDIPILGAAFRNKQITEQKNELLIFITPKLIRESLSVR